MRAWLQHYANPVHVACRLSDCGLPFRLSLRIAGTVCGWLRPFIYREKIHMVELIAPPEYYALTPAEKSAIVNGCGAAGARFDVVPDTMWGLDISEACNIHDYDYHRRVLPFSVCNAIFLANCALIISAASKWLRIPRLIRAITYFLAVQIAGKKAYEDAK